MRPAAAGLVGAILVLCIVVAWCRACRRARLRAMAAGSPCANPCDPDRAEAAEAAYARLHNAGLVVALLVVGLVLWVVLA